MNYIFDFDGTIADSLPAMVAVYNKNVRNNKNPLTPAEISTLRSMSSRKAIKALGVRWWQVPKLLMMGMSDFHALLPEIKPCEGMPELIKTLHKKGHKLFIATSNTSDNVRLFLEMHKLDGYFENIYGGIGLFRKSPTLIRLVNDHDLKRKETMYIGDETRDVRAAKRARIRVTAVTWGLNDAHILRKSKPHYLVDFASDILKIKIDKNVS